ncbi:hypothetical protein [Actinomadura rubrisoli]|uniref:WD40 repeat domain-containing protein n=1 Tax=Actinomadura rubrisoli TaxID=2530368 RepID=A0A4V2YVZ8_9ACTN|nr:hypothetical protein [Actinomadura rubrisoli]TDD83397.1 hypothetical protein E1298_21395 [Actinomadura rubrisoli]
MPESVPAFPLAPGTYDSVAATTAGPPLVLASRAGEGACLGQAWDLAARAALGPPIPDFPYEGTEWAFGLLPGGSPVVAWSHRDRMHVHDLASGAELVLEPERAAQPDLVGLAVYEGRGAVVAVFGPAHDAEVVVWDAATGDRLEEFGVWLGHWSAIDRWLLHAPPATGPLIGLTCDIERVDGADDVVDAYYVSVLDVERGEEVACLPSAGSRHAAFAQGPAGTVLVQPGHSGLLVRDLDGGRVAALGAPDHCDQVAAATVSGRLIVAADLPGRPGTLLAWDAASPAPSHQVKVPAPVNDFALTADGTITVATDDGLYTARIPC